MRLSLSPLALALSGVLLVACSPASQDTPAATGATGADDATAAAASTGTEAPDANVDPMDAILAGAWRGPDNAARDRYRNPRETLAFFGVGPSQTVIEITPGGGWYTEILAPLAQGKGRYIGAIIDPSTGSSERAVEYHTSANNRLREKLAAHPEAYGDASLVEINPAAPVFGEPGSADVVLTFRNVHNWVMNGNEAAMFSGFYDVLAPGGVLGVVEHRAAEGKTLEEVKDSGYMPEDYVIGLATAAGFVLEEKSEINANPADTRDHPNGVWTLPPGNRHDEADKDKYAAIGESDRMTLKFVKPQAAE